MKKLGDLNNEELLAQLHAHIGKGHAWHAQLIAYLVEVEDRRLDRLLACTSIWDFCIRKLGMSESEAQRRIAAARVVRRFPHVLGHIERGDIGLCALYVLRKHLTAQNVDELLREACGRSTREVEELVAARFPRPDVRSTVEPVALQPILPAAASASASASTSTPTPSPGAAQVWSLSHAPSEPSEPRPRVEPLSATRYRVELTVSSETKATLERIKDLMRHRNPTGDLEVIVDVALGLLRAKLEKERLGKTARARKTKTVEVVPDVEGVRANAELDGQDARFALPADADSDSDSDSDVPVVATPAANHCALLEADTGASLPPASRQGAPRAVVRSTKPRSGYIPRGVRRAVFERDGERCTYVDAEGNRCPARGHLELDHIDPRALGGADSVDNLRVRCRAHNALHAEQIFGRDHVERRIHLQRCKSEARAPVSLETVARALKNLGFREPEVRRALGMLSTKLDEGTPVETILREALRVLT